jgi:hypothetical protein
MDKIPIPTPPLELQEAYEHRVRRAEALFSKVKQHEMMEFTLFSSLQSRAFSGQL